MKVIKAQIDYGLKLIEETHWEIYGNRCASLRGIKETLKEAKGYIALQHELAEAKDEEIEFTRVRCEELAQDEDTPRWIKERIKEIFE